MENAFLLVLTLARAQELSLGSDPCPPLGCAAVGRADVGTWHSPEGFGAYSSNSFCTAFPPSNPLPKGCFLSLGAPQGSPPLCSAHGCRMVHSRRLSGVSWVRATAAAGTGLASCPGKYCTWVKVLALIETLNRLEIL